MWTVFFSALPILVLIFALTWVVQRFLLPHNDAGIVDVVWSPSLALTSIYYAVMLDGDPSRQLLLVAMACIWGFRLGLACLFRSDCRKAGRLTLCSNA